MHKIFLLVAWETIQLKQTINKNTHTNKTAKTLNIPSLKWFNTVERGISPKWQVFTYFASRMIW